MRTSNAEPEPVDIVLIENAYPISYYLRAYDHAQRYDCGEEVVVRAITPAYFLLLKLHALADLGRRTQDGRDVGLEHHDMEDILTLVEELADIREQIAAAKIIDSVKDAIARAMRELNIKQGQWAEVVEMYGGNVTQAEVARIAADLEFFANPI